MELGPRKAWVTGALIGVGFLIIIGLSCGRAGATPDPSWSIENVDTVGEISEQTSIALDTFGQPHISYYNNTNRDLKYAYRTGSAWSIENVDTEGDVGLHNSIALDSSGYTHISYFDGTKGALKYARWNGSSWILEIVDNEGEVGLFSSIAIDNRGFPHISYKDETNRDLKYARWTGDNWNLENIDSTGSVGISSSIGLDSSGNPHISYLDTTNKSLKYARWTGDNWNLETVDNEGDVGLYTSIALDSSGYPHISYHDGTNYRLKYARWDGNSWSIETVDSVGMYGGFGAIALGSDDRPHISYFDYTNADLKYARSTGSTWKIETVDSIGLSGGSTSIALDNNGYPHISYYTNGNLRYAYRVNSIPALTYNQVIPAVSPAGMTFTYYSIYTDNDEDPPAYIRAYIDNVPHEMTEDDPTDNNLTDGKMYKYGWATTTADISLHGYYFEASDGFDNVREPSEDNYSGPTVEKLLTTLTVSPSSFVIKTGGSKNLTATLTSGGAPLQDKLITWSASEGSVAPSSGYTDSQGKVTVAYTTPDNEATVTVTASFAEDSIYRASSGDGAGTVARFVAVLTFNRPDGSPFSNYPIYFRFAGGETDNYFGSTDNQGQIIITDENFAGKQVQFKSEDGKYAGAAYIGPAGGEVSVALSPGFEISAGTILSIIVVIAMVALVVMYARGRKWLEKAGEKPPEIPPIK